eukprot:TRINITY_DN1007_c0_g1_i1.p1 TRINITY_DN1007_c0_g1~~TRINITY_DN1007_c0_g1_i1.p1  ORF type:complete len:535 (+),score=32.15 TRINITY_DN1007_c0_g1_i1:1740-3344(+)
MILLRITKNVLLEIRESPEGPEKFDQANVLITIRWRCRRLLMNGLQSHHTSGQSFLLLHVPSIYIHFVHQSFMVLQNIMYNQILSYQYFEMISVYLYSQQLKESTSNMSSSSMTLSQKIDILKTMVDHLAPSRGEYEVVKDSGRELIANLLCVEGNHNKYYIMQILRKSRGHHSQYRFYRRWGRCGTDGQKMYKEYATLEEAVSDFDTLLEDKLEEYSEVHVSYPQHGLLMQITLTMHENQLSPHKMLVAKRGKEEERIQKWGAEEQKELESKKKYRRVQALTSKIIHPDFSLIQTAVKSLQHHTKVLLAKGANKLSMEDDYIFLCITLSKSLPLIEPFSVQISLANPVYKFPDFRACVFIKKLPQELYSSIKKSPLTETVKFKDYESLHKVSSDKQKFANFAESYDLFFCDKAYFDKLPRVLKEFLGKKNKCPYPLTVNENWEETIRDATAKTYVTVRKAGKFEFKIARISMSPDKAAENIASVIHNAVSHIMLKSEKHTNVQAITLKTKSSIELPIYKSGDKASKQDLFQPQ